MTRPKPDHEKRPTITREFLERCLRQGLTQREMIEVFHEETGEWRTRAAFGNQMKRYGLEPPRERQIPRYPEHVPWRVRMEHQNKYHLRMLRALARRDNGDELDEAEGSRLDAWLAKMDEDDVVIYYDPVTSAGFFRIPRESVDGDGYVRQPVEA